MAQKTVFSFSGNWYTVEYASTRYNKNKPRRLIVYDFSGILVFTTTYTYDHEIDTLLQHRFRLSLPSKED